MDLNNSPQFRTGVCTYGYMRIVAKEIQLHTRCHCMCCFSVMNAKGINDFTYILNPPLSIGNTVSGFVKMVRKLLNNTLTDDNVKSSDHKDTLGGLLNSFADWRSPYCFDLQ